MEYFLRDIVDASVLVDGKRTVVRGFISGRTICEFPTYDVNQFELVSDGRYVRVHQNLQSGDLVLIERRTAPDCTEIVADDSFSETKALAA